MGAFLDSLGPAYRLRYDEYATGALVSLRPELLTRYDAAADAHDQAAIGELFGYPLMAARAFVGGPTELLPRIEPERLECRNGLSIPFALSRARWQDELAVAREWAGVRAPTTCSSLEGYRDGSKTLSSNRYLPLLFT